MMKKPAASIVIKKPAKRTKRDETGKDSPIEGAKEPTNKKMEVPEAIDDKMIENAPVEKAEEVEPVEKAEDVEAAPVAEDTQTLLFVCCEL